MKRNYLIALVLSLSAVSWAQHIQINVAGSTVNTSVKQTATSEKHTTEPPFWEQVITPSDTKNSMNSTFFMKENVGIYSADDFIVEENVAINSILFNGYQMNKLADGLIDKIHLYFYWDEEGVPQGSPEEPGSEIRKYSFDYADFSVEDGGEELMGMMTYYLDLEAVMGEKIELGSGHYWLSIVFDIDITMDDFDERFEWTESLDTHLNKAKFISKSLGINNWSNTSLFGLDIAAFAFTLYGDSEVLSTSNIGIDHLKIYPNPAVDAFYLAGSQVKEVKAVQAINTIGQVFPLSYFNGKVNISHLAKGIYVVKVQTSEGVINQKLIKK